MATPVGVSESLCARTLLYVETLSPKAVGQVLVYRYITLLLLLGWFVPVCPSEYEYQI